MTNEEKLGLQKAIIEVYVPKWQIGQEVSIYFSDSMVAKGVVKEVKEKSNDRRT